MIAARARARTAKALGARRATLGKLLAKLVLEDLDTVANHLDLFATVLVPVARLFTTATAETHLKIWMRKFGSK